MTFCPLIIGLLIGSGNTNDFNFQHYNVQLKIIREIEEGERKPLNEQLHTIMSSTAPKCHDDDEIVKTVLPPLDASSWRKFRVHVCATMT